MCFLAIYKGLYITPFITIDFRGPSCKSGWVGGLDCLGLRAYPLNRHCTGGYPAGTYLMAGQPTPP